MTAARVMPCRGGGARSITRPSEPSDRHCTSVRAEGLGKLRRLSRCWRPALWPLSYARVAGEIGIEPMASCASDRRSTHAELLAVLMCGVDLAGLEPTASALQVRCSPVLSYRPKVPPPSLVGG